MSRAKGTAPRYKVGQRKVSYHSDVTRLEDEYTVVAAENRMLRRALNRIIAEDARGGYFANIAEAALETTAPLDEEVKP